MRDPSSHLFTDVSRDPSTTDQKYDSFLQKHVTELRKLFSVNSARRIDDAELLRALHPHKNTIAYTFLLLNVSAEHTSDIYLISLVAYLTQFDPIHARYVGHEWRQVLGIVRGSILSTGQIELLTPYRAAILRMDPISSTLTSSHIDFVDLCLQARRPRETLPLLDRDILHLPYCDTKDIDRQEWCKEDLDSSAYITKESGISEELSVVRVQEYYMLGAMVYMGLRKYQRASLFLELVLATPSLSSAVNTHMLEAYKKLILLSLIQTGYPPATNSFADQGMIRSLNLLVKPYEALSDAFKYRNVAKMHAEIDVGGSIWLEDGNPGLVRELASSLRRRRLLDLQSTYAALSVDQVATHLRMPAQDTWQFTQTMIEQGHLRASLSSPTDGSAPTIRFLKDHTPTDDQDTRDGSQRITAQIARIEELASAVQEADRKFGLTKEYIEHLRGRKRPGTGLGGGGVGPDNEDPMDMDLLAPDGLDSVPHENGNGDEMEEMDDEDIMAI